MNDEQDPDRSDIRSFRNRPRRSSSCRKPGQVRPASGIVHFSSRSDEWATPLSLFESLDREFGPFTLDPCATVANAKCSRFFTKATDGLAQDWGREVVFMNPPYGRHISLWMRKALAAAQGGATVVCLVPARTDTHWWHSYAMAGEVRFIRGRIKFGEAIHSAPFPSAIVIFRPPIKP